MARRKRWGGDWFATTRWMGRNFEIYVESGTADCFVKLRNHNPMSVKGKAKRYTIVGKQRPSADFWIDDDVIAPQIAAICVFGRESPIHDVNIHEIIPLVHDFLKNRDLFIKPTSMQRVMKYLDQYITLNGAQDNE